MFKVFDVTDCAASRPEVLGSKEKEWIQPRPEMGLGDRPYLFKIGRQGTGENWAEKVTAEIAKKISIPCANYELAIRAGSKGVISQQIMPLGSSLALGNLLLPLITPNYSGQKRYHQTQYQLSSVLDLLQKIEGLELPENCQAALTKPVEYFVGYLIFDTLIGNTDRHHENWGVVVERVGDQIGNFRSWLAPTFDHASSLGRSESDEKRLWRLTTRDRRSDVAAYASKAKTAFYSSSESTKPLTTFDVLAELKSLFPEACKVWTAQILQLRRSDFVALLEEVPDDWISQVAREFAVELLCINQHSIGLIQND